MRLFLTTCSISILENSGTVLDPSEYFDRRILKHLLNVHLNFFCHLFGHFILCLHPSTSIEFMEEKISSYCIVYNQLKPLGFFGKTLVTKQYLLVLFMPAN